MFCANCGQQISDGAVFCPHCGSKASVQPAPPPAAPQYQQAPPPHQQTPPQYQQAPPQYQQAPPQYQQAPPQYQQAPPQYQQAPPQYYQGPPQYQQGPPKKKNTGLTIAIVALVLVLVAGGIFAIVKSGKNKVAKQYNSLCELTAHGTESYLYARLLTEQLLQTDIMTADPAEVNALFEECLKTWDAIGTVSGKILNFANELSDKVEGAGLDKHMARENIFIYEAYADGEATPLNDMQTAAQSVASCAQLGSQFGSEAASVYSQIQAMRNAYAGPATSISEWHEVTETVAESFTTEVLISGDMDGGDGLTGITRSVHTLSRRVKRGTIAVSGVSTLVNVAPGGSTIIMGASDEGVVVDYGEVSEYIEEGMSTVSISSESVGPDGSRISFHATSLRQWFILDSVAGYRLTRRDKGNAISEPEVESDSVPVEVSDWDDAYVSVDDFDDMFTIPPPARMPISEWTQAPRTGGADDINNTTGTLSGNPPPPAPAPPTPPVPTEGNLDSALAAAGAGQGDITVSMLWGTHDDLDLHMDTPDGSHIYYSNKVAGGGSLDVDMNANSSNLQDNPIENIYFGQPAPGRYKVYIRNYRDRTEGVATRYLVRITIGGRSTVYEGEINDTGTEIVIAEFDYAGMPPEEAAPPVDENTLDEALLRAGASSGDITVSMLWGTWDDLDLHIDTPDGKHIYYGNKMAGGGVLDVDANANSSNLTTTPAENIYFAAPQSGHYKVYIRNYRDRTDEGPSRYLVRVTIGGQSQVFEGSIDGTGTEIVIIEFDYAGGEEGRIPANAAVFGDHHYAYYPQQMNWVEARDFCRSLGGYLATINTAEEQAFIESAFPGCTGWIGGYGSGSTWNWVTGEEMIYTNWADGEPNNQNGNEWCMHLFTGMRWNDLPNQDDGHKSGFICEWGPSTEVSVSDLEAGLSEAGALTGKITISMVWNTLDDLDLHVFTPSGEEICFYNMYAGGGTLDVDRIPYEGDVGPFVENVYFEDPQPGEYYVYIYDYYDWSDGPTDYLVRITVGNDVKTFEGTIDGTDTYIEIMGFNYTGGN